MPLTLRPAHDFRRVQPDPRRHKKGRRPLRDLRCPDVSQHRTLRSPTVVIPHITPRAVVCTPTGIVDAVVTIAGAMGGDAGHYSTDHRTRNYSGCGIDTRTTPTA